MRLLYKELSDQFMAGKLLPLLAKTYTVHVQKC